MTSYRSQTPCTTCRMPSTWQRRNWASHHSWTLKMSMSSSLMRNLSSHTWLHSTITSPR
ncbi:hypothetical protein DPMN_099627 [Dreissena polymorpha]|uniref:Uncharacterized protein n=1 Tax=Dreissena polymorpha TaxID=45954 RepID=A0A9D4LED2_DREPO|nr:hypothetical protein DPMN_099627 [Dreissena polymorpha]